MDESSKSGSKKYFLILGCLIIIIIVFVVWFLPNKEDAIDENKNSNTNINTKNNYLYTWKSERYIYTDSKTKESKEWILTSYKLVFYKDKLNICYDDNNDCEEHKYSITDNRILNIEGKSEVSTFEGKYYITYSDNTVILEKNNNDGSNNIFTFIKLGDEK